MSNDQVTIWGAGLKFGRKPEDGELLIGNGVSFDLATLSAGSGISISNTSGAITIAATGGGGTVTAVTATSPLKSSGGTAPDISLSGTVAVSNGGTGQTSLTANNVILGDGTNAVKFVAPGTNGNLLTSNGTTWTSAAPPSPPAIVAGSGISVSGTTVSIDTNNSMGVGAYAMLLNDGASVSNGATTTTVRAAYWRDSTSSWNTSATTGTWRNVSGNTLANDDIGLFIRTA
jgi:hypothetical protein